jgi:hypothetical protein
MGQKDQKQFTDAAAKARAPYFAGSWAPAVHACNRMAMFDMLPALAAIDGAARKMLLEEAILMSRSQIGVPGLNRIKFAIRVVENREIYDLGLPDDQVNDGREFLGCTRLDDKEVQNIITTAINKAKFAIDSMQKDTAWARGGTMAQQCCGVFRVAWSPILVDQRRASSGASLISNLAAAAHYMLARFHVCAARATQWQMEVVVDQYDVKKREAIMKGDLELKSMALDSGNRPFPPDFAITRWAYIGAAAGEKDRLNCNYIKDLPIFPEIDRKSY